MTLALGAATERFIALPPPARKPGSSAVNPSAHDNGRTPPAPPEDMDLEASVERYKSLSIAYRIMQAMAHQSEARDPELSGQKLSTDLADTSQTDDLESFAMSFSATESFQLQLEISSGEQNFTLDMSYSQSISVNVSQDAQGFSFSLSQTESFQLNMSFTSEAEKPKDPLILDLDGSDFSFNSEQTVLFDLDANGQLDRFDSLNGSKAYLAFDKNHNGVIDNGLELFGDAGGASDGFADLAEYDDNQDGQINADDALFKNLLLLNFNPDQSQTLRTLSSESIISLSLKTRTESRDYQDNQLILSADFEKADGSKGTVADFLLASRLT